MLSSCVSSASALRDCDWKLRADLDLAQRCAFVIFAGYVVYALFGFLLPASWIFLATAAALAGGVVKSAARLRPDGKAVLITGDEF